MVNSFSIHDTRLCVDLGPATIRVREFLQEEDGQDLQDFVDPEISSSSISSTSGSW